MSRGGRGGRGGGRGGRGGGRQLNNVPWAMDPNIVLDGKPSELFPAYEVPAPPILTKKEDKQVNYFRLFREQTHDGPDYTAARTWHHNPSEPGRSYGQEQVNKRYGTTSSKANLDPFLSMPTYSQRFTATERALPDFGNRPFVKEFFPKELHPTLDGQDVGSGLAGKKRKLDTKKTLNLSSITELRTAEDIFMGDDPQRAGGYDKALQLMEKLEKNEGGDGDDGLISGDDEDDWVRTNANEDGEDGEDEDQYDDESEDNDYNAEQYFEGNQDDDDYDDGGGDDGGGGEYF